MITWRVILSADGEALLVFVPAEDEDAARLEARKKLKHERHVALELLEKSIMRVERMMI